MRKFWHRPLEVVLTSLLVLLVFVLGACRSEPAPEETPAETPPAAVETSPATTPAAAAEITITGKMPAAWDKKEEFVGVGDTIVWKIGNGTHSVKFSTAACEVAQAKMTFTPPLVNCESAKKQAPGAEIVRATVKEALEADLQYVCGVHASMIGVLKPK